MAPKSFIEVRSESWLNLTDGLEQLSKSKTSKNKIYSSQQVNSVSRHSFGSWQLKDATTAISQSSLTSNNKNEHLLIRMRQQSYLNRSSNSLSSNLSNSIDLTPSLVNLQSEQRSTNYNSIYDKPFDEEEDLRWKLVNSDINKKKKRSDSFEASISLSSKNRFLKEEPRRLKYFRDKLQNKRRLHNNYCSGDNSRAEDSPLMRSLSSFSEKLNGKLTNFRHSWKHFLYNYNQQQNNHNNKLAKEEPYTEEEDDNNLHEIEQFRQTMDSSEFQQQKELGNNIANNNNNTRFSEILNRRQLTNDWLERYHAQNEEGTLFGAEMR